MESDSFIFVTGADGQVGRALKARLPNALFATKKDFDITHTGHIPDALAECDALIHLAALTDVDRCEESPELAWQVNAVATGWLARAAADRDIPMIYVSTDYVFDGSKPTAYSEEDSTNPINAYGRSKLEGERHVRMFPANLVVRTSWVFGDGRNFVRTILKAAGQHSHLTVVDDQTGRPTWAEDLATGIVFGLQRRLTGLLHVSGSGPTCSWADLAERTLKLAELDVPVQRVDTRSYALAASRKLAPRPRNSTFVLDRAKQMGLPLGDWRDGLENYIRSQT
jgi:dTDP-4-dehydrorhamnose reductase